MVDQLIHKGFSVHVFDMPGGCLHPRSDAVYKQGDITSVDQLRAALGGAVAVVHAAVAPASCADARKIEAINVGGTRAVLEAARAAGVRALVYTSSASVVFEGDSLTDVDELQPYADGSRADAATSARARAEALVLAASEGSFATCAIRPGVLYGQLDPVFVPGLAAAAYTGGSAVVLGGGKNFADFTYAENAAHAHVLAVEALLSAERKAGVTGRAFFVTDGEPTPFWGFCGCVLYGLGYAAPWLKLPPALGALLLGGLSRQAVAFATTHHYFSIAAARSALGYTPLVSQADALDATVKHFAHLRAGVHGPAPLCSLLELASATTLCAALAHAALTAPFEQLEVARAAVFEALAPAVAPLVDAGVPFASQQPHLTLLALGGALGGALLAAVCPRARPLKQPRVFPPTIPGMPLVGNLVDFLKGPLDLIAVARKHHRNIFTLRIGPQPITFCCHPDGYETFARGKDDVLDQAAVYGFTVPAFGKNVVYDAPLDKRLQQINFVAAIMNTSTMRSYVPKIIKEAEDFFDQWGEEGQVELHKEIAQLTTLTASRCLHGHEVRETLCKEVADLYHDIDGGMQPISTIMPRLPIEPHRRRDAARKELAKLFGARSAPGAPAPARAAAPPGGARARARRSAAPGERRGGGRAARCARG